MKKASLILIILLFVLSAFADEKWTKAEFQNFTVIGTASDKKLKQLGNKLEQFRQTLSVLLPKTKLNSSTPTIVYAFESIDGFQSYLTKDRRKNVGGFFSSTQEANYIVLPLESRGRDVTDVIYHEYFHYVMSKNLRNAPLWLNEGLAEYYSTFDINDDGTKVRLGNPIARRVLDLRKQSFIPLEKLFAVNHKSPEYNGNSKTGVFYAESWALVHYLIQANNGQRQTQFNTFIGLLSTGSPAKEAFQQVFQTDYNQIEKELRSYINKFTFPGIEYTFNQKVSYEETASLGKLSVAETKVKQGELLLLTNNDEDLEKKVAEILKSDENFAPAYRLLGKLRNRQKNYPEARKNFEKAVSLEPDSYLNNYYFAGVLRREGKNDEAVKLYREAIRLNPDIARLYASLGGLYQNLYRDAEAIEAYNQAVKLDPDNSDYPYILGQLFFRTGKPFLAAVRATYFINLEGWNNDTAGYAALVIYFGYQRENVTDRADQVLKLALEKVDKTEWVYSVFRYLNKELTEAELLVIAANSQDKQTEAYCYIGLNQLIQGKTQEAITNLNRVKDNGNKNFTEYGFAVKELERLNALPK
jgi:tetratricopeptide (TPR) repeat protein